MDRSVGLRLALGEKRTLTITETELVLQDASSKKTSRNSCAPLGAPPSGKQTIPLYSVLWMEFREGLLRVEFAEQVSKTKMKAQKWDLKYVKEEVLGEDVTPEAFIAAAMASAYGESKQRKRLYVLVNPASGPGKGAQHWINEIKPLLDAARVDYDAVILKRGGEATELCQDLDIEKYDAVVACSGDGTPHEIFNGLGKRPDAKKALARVPVCQLPCGSGNALSLNLTGSYYPSIATLAVIKGVVMPLDLTSVTQGSDRILSFLSQAVGIIAECDLGTENLRWMGSARFPVGLAMRVAKQKSYPFDLAIKTELEDKEKIRGYYKQRVTDPAASKLSVATENGTDETSDELPKLKYGTITDELPEGWELVSHDDIGNFYCGNMPYMSPEAKFFAATFPDDGYLDLITVKGDVPVVAATKTLLDIETEHGFFDNPNVKYQKITAYRLIPRNQKDGYISIDGEAIRFEPFQVEIHRGLGRVLSKRGKYEATGPLGWEKATVA